MREGKRGGFDINPRRTAVSETKRASGYTPDEFRPVEDVEADAALKGPKSFVDINEVSAVDDEYLTPEDRMAAELDRKRASEEAARLLKGGLIDEEGEGELSADDDLSDLGEEETMETQRRADEESSGPIVFDAPKKTREKKDIKIVRTNDMSSKKIRRQLIDVIKHTEKPRYKDYRKGKTIKY